MGCIIFHSEANQRIKSFNTFKSNTSSFGFNFKREEKLKIKEYQMSTIQEVDQVEEFSSD